MKWALPRTRWQAVEFKSPIYTWPDHCCVMKSVMNNWGCYSKKQHDATVPEGVSRKFHHQAMEKFEVRLISLFIYMLLHPHRWNLPTASVEHVCFCETACPHVYCPKKCPRRGPRRSIALGTGPHGLCCYMWLSSNQFSVTVKTISSSLPWDNF